MVLLVLSCVRPRCSAAETFMFFSHMLAPLLVELGWQSAIESVIATLGLLSRALLL